MQAIARPTYQLILTKITMKKYLPFVFVLFAFTPALAPNRLPEKQWLQYKTPEDAGFSSQRLQKAHKLAAPVQFCQRTHYIQRSNRAIVGRRQPPVSYAFFKKSNTIGTHRHLCIERHDRYQ